MKKDQLQAIVTDGLAQWRASGGDSERERDEVVADVLERLNANLDGHEWRDHTKREAVVGEALKTQDELQALELIYLALKAKWTLTSDWSAPLTPRQWLINDWLPCGRVALFAGKGGIGKSRLAVQLAAGLAQGQAVWLEGGPELASHAPRHVVYCSYEDEQAEVKARLPQWATADALRDRLTLAHGPALWQAPEPFAHPQATDFANMLQSYCEERTAALLVIDPVAAAYGGNENDRAAVRAYMSHWDYWARDSGCAVLMLAHPAKATGSEYSGSTDWQAAARSVWTLGRKAKGDDGTPQEAKAKEETATALECIKSSYARLPDHKWLIDEYPSWRAGDHFTEASTPKETEEGAGYGH